MIYLNISQKWLENFFTEQAAQGPHRSPESFWLMFLIKTHAKLLFFIVAQQLRDHDFNNLTLHEITF
jgi:hypothetical protein